MQARHTQHALRPCPGVGRLEPRDVPAIFTVTNLSDSSAGSLRNSIASANATAEHDTIKFKDGLTGTVFLSGEINISQPLEILDPSPDTIMITSFSGPAFFADFSNPVSIAISGVSITGCTSNKRPGAGISLYSASLTMSNCIISNNTSTLGGAGAVFCGGGLTATDTEFTNNRATNYYQTGGAIVAKGAVLTRCTLSGNTAYRAGGMFVAKSLEMADCLVANNIATGDMGGGIHLAGAFTKATIRNCTITYNSATQGYGGGIALGGGEAFHGALLVQNCTIADNICGVAGGGIGRASGTGTVVLESSIVSGNTDLAESPRHDIFLFGMVTAHASAVGTQVGIKDFSPDAISVALLGANLKLAPLAENGGSTKTRALLPGSPAINEGINPANLLFDQRGVSFPRINGKAPDIGAYEFQELPPTVVAVQINDGSMQRSRITSLKVSFDRELPVTANAFELRRQSDNAVVSMAAVTSGNSTTFSFVGGPLEFGSLADGRYTLTALASQINGGVFDGNGDGTIGDNFTFEFHRLFGDGDGDAEVDVNDFAAFRFDFGSGLSPFDFDDDGDVDVGDLGDFRARFGSTV